MEYQKIANFLNNESNQPSKFRTKNWNEINDDVRGAYSPNKQIRFKTAMLRSSLCDYSDAYILVKGNMTVNNTAAAGAAVNNAAKKVIFKNCAPFTNCISKISSFWRTLEMPLINCEVELILTWSENCVIISTNVADQNPTFTLTETNLYLPVVTLSTQDNAKLLP